MMLFQTRKKGLKHKVLSLVLAMTMVVGGLLLSEARGIQVVQAAETAITSMGYYSSGDGPVLSKSGVGSASFGFVMPIFNGGAATWEDVASDLTVNVKVNGNWVNIDDTSFTYNVNWGNWTDSGFYGYWFKVSETTNIQLASKSNGVTLDYKLVFANIQTTTISSMTATQGPELTAGVTGSIGFTYPMFNNDTSIPYDAVADDLKVFVKTVGSSEWIDIDNNAASGWIYDSNFGQFTDGGGGYWFTVDESINVKLESKSSMVSLIYTITYSEPVRNSYTLTAYDVTSFTADELGAIGIALPKIDGSASTKSELDNFVYEIRVNGEWVELSDFSKSSFSYSGNGYNKLSDANQWGYWVDHIYGLWFQPIQVDMEIRIGYPLDGQKGNNIGSNYVTYTFIGNPNAVRPDVSDLGNIEINTTDNTDIVGMNLIWNDEFSSAGLDTSAWNYNTGYYINDDPATWGWGNNELEYYTDAEKNVSIKDGSLNIVAYEEPKSFPQDPNRYAMYSSGKITTKDKFTFQYGRIDFRAKLPRGNGMWPALWLLPNDDTYGTWAASGEIDVMEARGRLPGATSGAIHFGGQWPANTYIGGDYSFTEGQTIDSDFHVYSAVWEEDNIKWYVDGKCFFKATSEQWYSNGASGDENAPFDQEFYIIMNLAVGGWFDGGQTPDASDLPATMQVDYVRVYKADGSGGDTPGEEDPETPTTYVDVAAGKTVSCSGIENDTLSAINLTDSNTGTRWASNYADDAWFTIDLGATYNINQMVLNWEASYGKQYEILVSEDGMNFTSVTKQSNGIGGIETIAFDVVTARYVKLQGIVRALPYGYSLWDVKVMGATVKSPEVYGKISSGKTVVTSSNESQNVAGSYAVDDNTGTRWSSDFSDNQWIYVDLGTTAKLSKVVFNWEAAYAKKYNIQVSQDGVNWTMVKEINDSDGGIDEIDFNVVSARYLKMQGIERAIPYGYSLYEMEVYGIVG